MPDTVKPHRPIIITGASRGIGAATARLAAERGYSVCVNYLRSRAEAEAVVDEIESLGGAAFAFRADTSVEAEVRDLFDATAGRFGGIEALVNSAGIMGGPTRLDGLSAQEMVRLFEINVFGCLLCCREAVRRMSTGNGGKGGSIVNVSSVAATNGSSGERVHYAASKGAVNSFSVGLSREVAREGIRVNLLSPGLTRTALNPPERLARLEGTVPIGRVAEPAEIARGILWLLSAEADYCVGANVVMSGGR